MKIIRIDTMRKLEQQAIASGVPGYELMRRAGEGAAREIRAFARGREFGRAVVLAGRGNNGGDALVVAARLGLPVIIYAAGPLNELRGEAAEIDLPPQVTKRAATKEDLAQILPYLMRFCAEFSHDPEELAKQRYTVIVPNSKTPYKQMYVAN